jgi:hypothetical protein
MSKLEEKVGTMKDELYYESIIEAQANYTAMAIESGVKDIIEIIPIDIDDQVNKVYEKLPENIKEKCCVFKQYIISKEFVEYMYSRWRLQDKK